MADVLNRVGVPNSILPDAALTGQANKNGNGRHAPNPLLDAALGYVRRGWRALPLHWPDPAKPSGCSCRDPECSKPAKHPYWVKGTLEHGCNSATTDETLLRDWWRRAPNANCGIATGEASGLWVLDVDVDKGGDETLAALERRHGPLPETVEQITGSGGRHLLFSWVPGLKNDVEFLPGLDVRTDGGLIVAAPSIHVNGRRYALEVDHHPDEVTIAPAPDWLIDLIRQAGASGRAGKQKAPADEPIPEGQRNERLFQAGCAMRRRGMSETAILAGLLAENTERCQPPLSSEEVSRIATSCARYDPAAPSTNGNGRHVEQEPAAAADLVAELLAQVEKQSDVNLVFDAVEMLASLPAAAFAKAKAALKTALGKKLDLNDLARAVSERRRELRAAATDGGDPGMVKRLADAITDDSFFAQNTGQKLYVLEGGVYHPHGEQYIKRRVKALLEEWGETDEWSSHRAEETVEYIRVDSRFLWERPPLDIINVKNGLLNVNTRELADHSPDFLSPIQLPVTYDPQATCPEIDHFIESVFPEDARAVAYEITAWLMTPDTSIQKTVLLTGEGANGKGTYLALQMNFVGRQNRATLSLQRMEEDKFAVARLIGKLANICADLPSKHLECTSIFKAITGGDPITGEYKHGEHFEFTPFARLVFSANHPPRSTDASFAFFRRWLVIPFDQTFTNGTAEHIPREVLDARLADPRELSGLLNKALDALSKLRARGFTESPTMLQAFNEFRQTTDPFAVWLDTATDMDPTAWVTKKDLQLAYNADCARAGRPPLSSQAFGRRLREQRPEFKDNKDKEKQRTVDGKLTWVWEGICLRTPPDHTAATSSRV
jgi:putative DNA primase/helicase